METERGNLSESARGLTDRLRQDGRQQIETRKLTTAESIDEVAHALGRAGEQLDQSQPTLAAYANQIAGNVSSLAARIREGSIEDLIDDTREIARRNPGLFILGGFAIGVALSRFMKASQQTTSAGDFSTENATTASGGFRSDFADASADQSAYPSQAYSPSVSTTEQTATPSNYPPTSGV